MRVLKPDDGTDNASRNVCDFKQLMPCKDPEAPAGDRYKFTCGIIWMQNAHTNVTTGFDVCVTVHH